MIWTLKLSATAVLAIGMLSSCSLVPKPSLSPVSDLKPPTPEMCLHVAAPTEAEINYTKERLKALRIEYGPNGLAYSMTVDALGEREKLRRIVKKFCDLGGFTQ